MISKIIILIIAIVPLLLGIALYSVGYHRGYKNGKTDEFNIRVVSIRECESRGGHAKVLEPMGIITCALPL